MDLQELAHCFERVIYKYMFHCLEGVIRVILPGGGGLIRDQHYFVK
jgi:hypothetical protein